MLYIDLAGHRFGKLVVKNRALHKQSGAFEWLCECDCGKTKVVPSGSLRQGRTKSCGCMATKGRRKDISGQKFGRLTVVEFHSMNSNRTSNWKCLCDCGTELVVRKSCLDIKGTGGDEKTYSCGCQKRENVTANSLRHGETKHGKSASKEYACWTNMLQRCLNPRKKEYKSYGAIGVQVCPQWCEKFENFLEDVGRAPADNPYIDRINPYGHYEPGNVRWASFEQSNANKRGLDENHFSKVGRIEHDLAKLTEGSDEYVALATYLEIVKGK